MAIAARTVSVCAFILSAAGFGWTIYEWHRSGARLKISMTSLTLISPIAPVGGQWFVAFDISNSGRTPTTVDAVGFMAGKGNGVFLCSEPAAGANPIPKRLEPGESFNFPVLPADVLNRCAEKGVDPERIIPYASTGHGKFKGKWTKVGLHVLKDDPTWKTLPDDPYAP